MSVASIISRPTTVSLSWKAGRQCMNLTLALPEASQQGGVDLVVLEQRDALVPDLPGLPHRDPHVGVDEVDALDARGRVGRDGDAGAGPAGDVLRDGHDILRRRQLRGPHHAHVAAHERPHDQQRAAHVEAQVAHEGVRQLPVLLAAGLVHGEEVGQHLGRMPLVGEPVEDGHAGEGREGLDVRLRLAAVLDAVEEAAQHAGRVGDRFLVPHLGPRRVEIRDVRALVEGGHLEGAARARGGLLEDEGDVLAAQAGHLRARDLGLLEVGRELQQEAQLRRREVDLLEEAAVAKVDGHVCLLGARPAGSMARVGRLSRPDR